MRQLARIEYVDSELFSYIESTRHKRRTRETKSMHASNIYTLE